MSDKVERPLHWHEKEKDPLIFVIPDVKGLIITDTDPVHSCPVFDHFCRK